MTTQVPASMTEEGVTQAQLAGKVNNTGNETIGGVKTFTSQPILPQKLTQGTAQNSTSGTSIDFTSIPSWVRRITIAFNGVSTSGTAAIYVQIGTSSGIETTGYSGNGSFVTQPNFCGASNITAAFTIGTSAAAADARSGTATLVNVSGNIWVMQGMLAIGSGTNTLTALFGAGTKTLAGVLDRVRITTSNGTDTFDAGSINILYE